MASADTKVEIEWVSGTWTDVTSRCWSAAGGRGKSYELANMQAGQMTFMFDNSDGRFTPNYTTSPYYPNVVLFKRIRVSTQNAGVNKVLWTGYIEQYPVTFAVDGGHFQVSPIVAVDAMGMLNRITLPKAYEAFVRTKKPTRYWPLTDRTPQGTYYCSVTGKVATEMTYGGKVQVSQAASPMRGDEGVNVPLFDPPRPGMPNNDTPPENFSIIRLTSGANAELPNGSGTWSIFVSFFVTPKTNQIGDCVLINVSDSNSALANFIQIRAGTALNDRLLFHINDFIVNSGNGRTIDTGINVHDGFPHTAYFEKTSTTQWKWSVDGGTIVSQTGDTWNFGPLATGGTLDVGASWPISNSNHGQAFAGYASNVAVFNRALTQQELVDMTSLSNDGLILQNLNSRVDWILRTANKSSILGTAVGTGKSAFQASHMGGKTAAQAISDVNQWELGSTYVNGDGNVIPVSRHSRALPVAKYALGDSSLPGSYPISSLELDFDSAYLKNDVSETVLNGPTVRAFNQTNIDANGLFAFTETIETIDETDALARAQYFVSKYGVPDFRVKTITLRPSENAAIWPLIVQLELNDCVRVDHAPLAGIAISNKLYWVESIDYSINSETFEVKLLLSPAISENWLALDDATKGKIGATAANFIKY